MSEPDHQKKHSHEHKHGHEHKHDHEHKPKQKQKYHDEDVDEFVPDEDEMTETSEFDSVKGPAKTFSMIDPVTRKRIFATPIIVSIILSVVAVLIVLCLFVPLWDPIGHLYRIKIRISMQDIGYSRGNVSINFGEQFMNMVLTSNQTKDLLGWEFVTGLKAREYTFKKVSSDVVRQKYWAGLIIPQNLTQNVIAAYTTGELTIIPSFILGIRVFSTPLQLLSTGWSQQW